MVACATEGHAVETTTKDTKSTKNLSDSNDPSLLASVVSETDG